MKRLIIVVEGQTEEEFVNNTLGPYLVEKGVLSVTPIKLRTSRIQKGGLVSYVQYKRDIENYLKRDKAIIITTLIDFFRLPTSFPKINTCLKLALVDDQLDCLEEAINSSIDNKRFVPYIQKHEFEALVFACQQEIKDFVDIFTTNQREQILQQLQQVIQDYPNPEDINGRPQFAPSKRLMDILPSYDKVLHGNLIIESADFEDIVQKCPRFRNWLTRIIEKCTTEF